MPDGSQVEIVHYVRGNQYGRVDGPRNWELTFASWMVSIGFERCESDLCLWVRGVGSKDEVYATNFCDDIIITAPHECGFERFTDELRQRWEDCDVKKPSFLLGCDLEQGDFGIRMTASTKNHKAGKRYATSAVQTNNHTAATRHQH